MKDDPSVAKKHKKLPPKLAFAAIPGALSILIYHLFFGGVDYVLVKGRILPYGYAALFGGLFLYHVNNGFISFVGQVVGAVGFLLTGAALLGFFLVIN